VHARPRPYILRVDGRVCVYIKIGTSVIPAGDGLINNYRLGTVCVYYGRTSKKKKIKKTPGRLD